MPAKRDTLHLLLLMQTQNHAENIVSMLRNSGNATRAHQVSSLADFVEQLQDRSWDLVIAQQHTDEIHWEELQKQIKRLNKDLPLILVTQEDLNAISFESALKKGAATVVPLEESNVMLMVIERELKHLHIRREKRMLEVKLREAEKRSQSLLESSKDAVGYIHDGMHVYANQAYLELFGYDSVDDLEGMPIMDMVHTSGQKEFKAFLKKYDQAQQSGDLKTKGVDGEGSEFSMTMQFSPATYAEEECTQVVIRGQADSSELEEQLSEIRSRDLLTHLYNKTYFNEQLEHAVDSAVLKGATGAVFYINIDQFNKIKSDIGVNHCDTVVVAVAEALQKYLPENAQLARIGEDIFAFIMMGIDAERALQQAEKLRDIVAQLLIAIEKRTTTVTTSTGVALITENSSKPDDILQQAHQASDLVRKLEGHEQGNGVNLFVPAELNDTEKDESNLEQQLTDALKNNSFRLLFQPLINLRGDETEHYETLLRLPQANGDDISAGEFLNSADISDALKRKIDRWVILHTTKLLGEHREKGHNTRMFINLSSASLSDDSLAGWIGVALNAARLPKGAAIFQFNEEDAGHMLKQCHEFTHALLERGIPTALTRFGCALNPFQQLQHLDVEYVKVDGSFTQELSQSPDNQKHLKELLEKLHEEEKRTIVPLVESAASVANLWQLGVHFIQGHYVQPPQAGMIYDFDDE
ncbi:EAL domain-containing protein [Bacterioplanoides sp.]|uniref:EAL domain-containing response regulator n=1 Tax=Bacterioplanoides sp. TaxID=2066072 RepID=UPI003B003276